MDTAKNPKSLKQQALGLIVGLAAQYLLGMAAAMFAPFPEGQTGDSLWPFAWQQPIIALHIVLGLALLAGAVYLVLQARRQRVWLVPAGTGLVAIVVAIMAGSSFISSQSEAYSYVMAVGFLAAILAYAWGLYRAK
ncbi:MAG TPA: hypothetical protein VLI05_02800 [Candidatus Saccharimonadia bacterium]|nr:hypothetical protein [Candidatus Saccharimonadia bacterium]